MCVVPDTCYCIRSYMTLVLGSLSTGNACQRRDVVICTGTRQEVLVGGAVATGASRSLQKLSIDQFARTRVSRAMPVRLNGVGVGVGVGDVNRSINMHLWKLLLCRPCVAVYIYEQLHKGCGNARTISSAALEAEPKGSFAQTQR